MMKRVRWNGDPLEGSEVKLPSNLRETIFEHLPPPVPITPKVADMAERYLRGEISGPDYVAMQAAAFITPKSLEQHEKRRRNFQQRAAEAEDKGFTVPAVFRELVMNDAYVDRLHHNCLWLQMPEELWALPADPDKLMFLAFSEGQGCYHWHLLLEPDGSHSVVGCGEPFGMVSCWMGKVPDYSEWEVQHCANSIEEWLYHFFQASAGHDRRYLESLKPWL